MDSSVRLEDIIIALYRAGHYEMANQVNNGAVLIPFVSYGGDEPKQEVNWDLRYFETRGTPIDPDTGNDLVLKIPVVNDESPTNKRYRFSVTLIGEGKDIEEAFTDALCSISDQAADLEYDDYRLEE